MAELHDIMPEDFSFSIELTYCIICCFILMIDLAVCCSCDMSTTRIAARLRLEYDKTARSGEIRCLEWSRTYRKKRE